MNKVKENSFAWVDLMRGTAIFGVFIHHWFILIKPRGGSSVIYTISHKMSLMGGTFVQLFFLLSGFGLFLSYYGHGHTLWKDWATRRLRKILIPYWIVVILTCCAQVVLPEISAHGPEYEYNGSIIGVFSYLLLFRNVYPPAWGLNVTYWFMPVIIGLYCLFPFFIKILEKYGPMHLLLMAFIISYTTISLFVSFGYFYSTVNHQRDWFFFYTLQFVFGILLAYYTINKKISLSKKNALFLFGIGLTFYAVSAMMKKIWAFGGFYNDALTTLGLFLIVYCVCMYLEKYNLRILTDLIVASGRESFLIYLIHFPLIIVVGKILMGISTFDVLKSSFMPFTGGLVFLVILFISKMITTGLTNLTALNKLWLCIRKYNKIQSPT